MKEKFPWKDMLVLGGALAAAIAGVAAIQAVSGRIDGVASMVFVLAAFFVSMYTEGYLWGVAASVIGMLAVNFAFRSPYFAFNFTLPENLFSGAVMLVVSIMTSTLTTRVKKQEQLRMESETEKMRANLLRAVSHDLRTLFTGTLPSESGADSGKHGMGIGLSVCAAIIKAHGGEIKAESKPGEGTAIRFWLETEEIETEETEDEQ